jgi:hypothetical protein
VRSDWAPVVPDHACGARVFAGDGTPGGFALGDGRRTPPAGTHRQCDDTACRDHVQDRSTSQGVAQLRRLNRTLREKVGLLRASRDLVLR